MYPTALQPHDLGWIAGTIDLKGTVVVKKNQDRATPQSVLLVESKELAVVRRLALYTGTAPEQQVHHKIKEEWNRRGCAEHCPEKHNHVQSVAMPPVARWQVTGSSLVVVLYNVLPYLTESAKRERFKEDMELVASYIPVAGQGRAAIDKAIRRLAGLGWLIPPYLFRDDEEFENSENLVVQNGHTGHNEGRLTA
jgi:hypothetical protein